MIGKQQIENLSIDELFILSEMVMEELKKRSGSGEGILNQIEASKYLGICVNSLKTRVKEKKIKQEFKNGKPAYKWSELNRYKNAIDQIIKR